MKAAVKHADWLILFPSRLTRNTQQSPMLSLLVILTWITDKGHVMNLFLVGTTSASYHYINNIDYTDFKHASLGINVELSNF